MSNIRNIEQMAGMFKALSNPNRLRIFRRLVACCPPGTACREGEEMSACVGDLGKDLQIGPSTVSHHIKELHRAGLISTERCGQSIRCRVEPQVLKDLSGFFGSAPPIQIEGSEAKAEHE